MATGNQQVIIVGPAHPLRPGGITTFNERLCKAFIQSGYQCSIWSFSLQYPSFLFPGTSQFTDAPAPKGITIRSVINSVNPFNWVKVGMQLRRSNADIIVVRYWIPLMGPCLGTILRFVSKKKGVKIICIADNVIPHESRIGDKQFTGYFVKPVDKFIVMSRQVLADLKQFTNKPAKLIPHPLYDNFGTKISAEEARAHLIEKLGLPIKQEDKLLVFFGLVRHYKGLDILLDALAKTKDPSIKLLVAGEFYDKAQPYFDQIERLGLKDRVIIHNQFIAEADVKYFICAADCIIQPYREATQSGVTPVAYHFEVPMIVTNVGGLPEMVPDNEVGLIAEPDANDIALKTDRFFEMGKAYFLPYLLNYKKKLSWDVLVHEIADL
ncbi:glycosyltransferase [Polluticaenibacter yanchengensis]|uniref:Glycosyltransferase n=1 Tax=Polluticaenibacter yanchengensis TaxID=3014562 RepID=A0ABT4UGK7_9BACT|nr:glycosyltransferase [Chitinophagaceae bacterium LY-5]